MCTLLIGRVILCIRVNVYEGGFGAWTAYVSVIVSGV